MPKKKTFTLKEINYHIKDEHNAVKEYKHDGLPKLAADEHRHEKFWINEKKKKLK